MIEIKKIEEGMTGQQVADLLYDNFLALAKKCEEFPEEDVQHLVDKHIATLRGNLYAFIRTIFEECFGDKKFFEEVCEYIDIYFYSDDIIKKLYDVVNKLIEVYLTTGDMYEYIKNVLVREVEKIFENLDDHPELIEAFKNYIREVITNEYKGRANGLASLDGNGKVPTTQLPYSSDTQDGIITSNEHKLLNTTLPNRLTTAENKLNTLNGNASVTGSVDQKVATAVTNLVNGAPTAYDTLKEIADWIATSDASAANLVAKLNKLENEHDTDIVALAQKDTDLQNQINAIKTKTDGIQAGAEANVQSDWNVSDTTSDAYIKNKPGNASQSAAGLMSAADKKKLDNLSTNANVQFTATYTSGTKIGTITINGVATDIYIPVWNGTLAQYNALSTKNSNYIYNITE